MLLIFVVKKQLFDTRTPPPPPTASVFRISANNDSLKHPSPQSRQSSKCCCFLRTSLCTDFQLSKTSKMMCHIHNKTSTVLINSCNVLSLISRCWFANCLHWCGQYDDMVMAMDWWWRDDKVLQLSLRIPDEIKCCWQNVTAFNVCKLISGERKQ